MRALPFGARGGHVSLLLGVPSSSFGVTLHVEVSIFLRMYGLGVITQTRYIYMQFLFLGINTLHMRVGAKMVVRYISCCCFPGSEGEARREGGRRETQPDLPHDARREGGGGTHGQPVLEGRGRAPTGRFHTGKRRGNTHTCLYQVGGSAGLHWYASLSFFFCFFVSSSPHSVCFAASGWIWPSSRSLRRSAPESDGGLRTWTRFLPAVCPPTPERTAAEEVKSTRR